jgi:hypothetical protein
MTDVSNEFDDYVERLNLIGTGNKFVGALAGFSEILAGNYLKNYTANKSNIRDLLTPTLQENYKGFAEEEIKLLNNYDDLLTAHNKMQSDFGDNCRDIFGRIRDASYNTLNYDIIQDKMLNIATKKNDNIYNRALENITDKLSPLVDTSSIEPLFTKIFSKTIDFQKLKQDFESFFQETQFQLYSKNILSDKNYITLYLNDVYNKHVKSPTNNPEQMRSEIRDICSFYAETIKLNSSVENMSTFLVNKFFTRERVEQLIFADKNYKDFISAVKKKLNVSKVDMIKYMEYVEKEVRDVITNVHTALLAAELDVNDMIDLNTNNPAIKNIMYETRNNIANGKAPSAEVYEQVLNLMYKTATGAVSKIANDTYNEISNILPAKPKFVADLPDLMYKPVDTSIYRYQSAVDVEGNYTVYSPEEFFIKSLVNTYKTMNTTEIIDGTKNILATSGKNLIINLKDFLSETAVTSFSAVKNLFINALTAYLPEHLPTIGDDGTLDGPYLYGSHDYVASVIKKNIKNYFETFHIDMKTSDNTTAIPRLRNKLVDLAANIKPTYFKNTVLFIVDNYIDNVENNMFLLDPSAANNIVENIFDETLIESIPLSISYNFTGYGIENA